MMNDVKFSPVTKQQTVNLMVYMYCKTVILTNYHVKKVCFTIETRAITECKVSFR